MSVERLRQDLRDIRIFCSRYFPFIVIPLSYLRIVSTRNIPTAGVDEKGTLAINPDWWLSLTIEEKRFVAIHESLHVVLLHPFRRKGFDKTAYYIAADGKVNNAIRASNVLGIEFKRGYEVTLEKISAVTGIKVEVLDKMSAEEIARELERLAEKVAAKLEAGEGGSGEGCSGGLGGDLMDGEVEGEIVQEADKSVADGRSREELERRWKLVLERARDFAKQAGNMPAGLERIVEEVLEAKPPWHLIVRFGVRNHSKQDSSFTCPNRRGDEYPGHYGYRYSVWCLIDTSGSISEDELKHFLGIVKFEAKRADVYVIPWDGEAYEVLKATRPAEVARKIAPRMRGGGGTVIKPALSRALGLMRPGDALIVLTDGDIFDANSDETRRLFREVAAKAGFAMLGYTRKPVDAPGFSQTYIDLRRDYG